MSLRDSDRLNERIRRYMSAERLTLVRNLGYGGAAVCLAILAGLTQVGAKDMALRTSVYAASIALPTWLLIGTIYEYYIFLGKQSYGHLRTKFSTVLTSMLFLIAGPGMFVATGGIIWFLIPEAAYVFAIAGWLVVLAGVGFHFHLAHWWGRQEDTKHEHSSTGGGAV